jgi:hypothetical protein
MTRILVLIAVVWTNPSTPVTAQGRLTMGPVIGINYNIHTGSGLEKVGRGYGILIGGQADMSFTKYLGVLASIYFYDNRSGDYSATGTDAGIDFSRDVSVRIAYLEFEPLIKLTVPAFPIYLIAGGSVGFKIEGNTEATTNILTPGFSFPSGFASQTDNAAIDNVNTRFEFKVGVGYTYRLFQNTWLTSQLTFASGLSDVVKNVDWKLRSFGLATSLEFDVGK